MLSYDDALARILATVVRSLETELVPFKSSVGRALAEPVFAREDVPAFANSAVDGFAVHAADLSGVIGPTSVVLPVSRTIAAGFHPGEPLQVGSAARILTGAPVPGGADAIVMVEDIEPEGDSGTGERVRFRSSGSASFIRAAGSDIERGAKAIDAGVAIDAGIIGLLAALNYSQVSCARRPRVGLIVTGDEIVPVGAGTLAVGKIRDANGPALAAAIREAGAEVTVTAYAGDSAESTRAAILQCAGSCDVIVSTGGVSVGEYDYVKAIVKEIGSLDFWRIDIKPGKPLAFGRVKDALFFGLPGNPVSSLVTFELFVRPTLRKLAGFSEIRRRQVSVTLAIVLPHESGRREFVRARVEWFGAGYIATPTGAQGSHRLSTLVGANAYLIAAEDHGDYAAGARLPALLLDE